MGRGKAIAAARARSYHPRRRTMPYLILFLLVFLLGLLVSCIIV